MYLLLTADGQLTPLGADFIRNHAATYAEKQLGWSALDAVRYGDWFLAEHGAKALQDESITHEREIVRYQAWRDSVG